MNKTNDEYSSTIHGILLPWEGVHDILNWNVDYKTVLLEWSHTEGKNMYVFKEGQVLMSMQLFTVWIFYKLFLFWGKEYIFIIRVNVLYLFCWF